MQMTHRNEPINQNTTSFLIKICEQLETEVQQQLINSSKQLKDQTDNKILEKWAVNLKNSVIKILHHKLPQIVAIQDKFKQIVVGLNDEVEAQKQRTGFYLRKYEQIVLECDRYKMETVQVNQFYETALKEKIQLMTQIQNRGNNKHNFINTNQQKITAFTQTEQQYNDIPMSVEVIKYKLEQNDEEKLLFKQQLTRCNQIIQELKQCEVIATEKIKDLEQQVKMCNAIIEEEKDNSEMLKEQITKLVLNLQEEKIKNEEQNVKNGEQIQKIKEESQQKIKAESNQKDKISEQLQKMKIQILELNLNCKERSDEASILKQLLVSKEQLIKELQSNLNSAQSENQSIEKKLNKMDHVSKNQTILQQKYNKKFQLLSKYNKEFQNKIKHYKQQNQRLYEAMDQYASKQSKLKKSLANSQLRLLNQEKNSQKLLKINKVLKKMLMQVKKQMSLLKKQYVSGINLAIKAFFDEFSSMKQSSSIKVTSKINELQQIRKKQIQSLTLQLSLSQQQLKIVQQKCIDSELQAAKTTSTLLHSKTQTQSQLLRRNQLIEQLQIQLKKQKDFNTGTVNKMAEAMKKHQTFEFAKKASVLQNAQQHELERDIIFHKARCNKLEIEYRKVFGRDI